MSKTPRTTETTIDGIKCRVVRGVVSENRYQERSSRPEIRIYADGMGLVASGNCTISGAIENAARVIASRKAL